MTDDSNVIEVTNFSLSLKQNKVTTEILKDISISVKKGERWGITGESGAGKSMLIYALASLLPEQSIETTGSIQLTDRDQCMELLAQPYRKRRAVCAKRLAMILQDSINALNPFETIEHQWKETVLFHHPEKKRQRLDLHFQERLKQFGLMNDRDILKKYPHQLSGGMKQRIAIAMALESNADILIADEPTTSLDSVNQRKLIEYIENICRQRQMTLLYISHNPGIIQKLCTHVAIMKAGELVESGKVEEILKHPKTDIARHLLGETKKLYKKRRKENVLLAQEEEVLRIEKVDKYFSNKKILNTVSFQLYQGEILGVLGVSGCGKSTLAKMILGLLSPDSGEIYYREKRIDHLTDRGYRPFRKEIQMVFQNPFDCLDPGKKILDLLMEPLKIWESKRSIRDKRNMVKQVCKDCGLTERCLDRYPGEFSGGQLQRIALARALVMSPDVLVADEIVSALDVSVQNQILQMLRRLKRKYGLSVLFITHDLAVMRAVADRVMVVENGEIVQIGEAEYILEQSRNELVRNLREAAFYIK